ncbi:hypothetical protein DS843_22835 [Roseomonas genomospecies 6]|uniref:DUF2384 domain-containing protein n=2 Tax=Roseomonas genomospecies 6 TaxID=214106 RepID=A0A9W7KQW2_9PROT|nr:hypothetical protein DS843_22835 [Roseomonas genomospecies 6]
MNDLVARARWWAEVQAAEDPNGRRAEDTLYAALAKEIERLRADLDALEAKRRAADEAGKTPFEINHIRWQKRKDELLREVATLPGHLVAAWLRDGKVFGVIAEDGETRVPAFQITKGKPHPLIGQLLQILRPRRSDWEIFSWFARPDTWTCRGRRPLELLDEDPAAVLDAARHHVEERWD